MGLAGARALSIALSLNTALTSLNVSQNDFGAVGCVCGAWRVCGAVGAASVEIVTTGIGMPCARAVIE